MRKFAVVTDSASDINQEAARRLGIRIVPLHIVAGGRDYRDGMDIQIDEYLDLLEQQQELPQTSQPAPADFVEVYRALIEEGYTEILSIHIARELSSTIETPRYLAREVFKDVRIEVIDSYAATVGEGAMVLEAAAIAEAGGTMDEAIERVLAIRDTFKIHFVPDTLANLVKGGRASRAQHLATSILNVKVVIALGEKGCIDVAHKAKGMRNAVVYMVRQLVERSKNLGKLTYYKLHTRSERGLELIDKAVSGELELNASCAGIATIGPCIATHVGEHAVGLLSYPAELHSPLLDEVDMFYNVAC
ncbi:DegV family protein [Collinsella tanakaei]|uniref:DegV family protein n=1 Tax=Collinsella ihumii TaxID=1720204 RepID=UPI00195C3E27|nr:DegV family protein [Collinsella ihumii]MBM6689352.1 DegV family protein [Collinsella tanakaei]MDN0055821.1 DegV family protein [Collinsella ihumii]